MAEKDLIGREWSNADDEKCPSCFESRLNLPIGVAFEIECRPSDVAA